MNEAVITIFPQIIFPFSVVPIAMKHIDHISHKRDLEFPQFHPLQLRKTESEPAVFPFSSVFNLAVIFLLLAVNIEQPFSRSRQLLSPFLEVVFGFIRESFGWFLELGNEIAFVVVKDPGAGIFGINA